MGNSFRLVEGYKAVSQAAREVFTRHTDAVERLSFDEACLDVTQNEDGLSTATLAAKTITSQAGECTE